MLPNKIKAIIVDDEPLNIETLDRILTDHCPEVLVIARCKNPLEAIGIVMDLKPDILFLDINMPELNGFDFLNKFENIPFKIVFTTAYSEYALKAIKYAAFEYILKPINYEEVVTTIEKLKASASPKPTSTISQSNNANTNLALPTPEGFYFIDINEIIYCKSDNSYTNFVLRDGKKILVSRGLKETSEILEKYNFFRIHQSFLVNPKYIKKYHKHNNTLSVTNGEELPVAVRKREEFLQFVERL